MSVSDLMTNIWTSKKIGDHEILPLAYRLGNVKTAMVL